MVSFSTEAVGSAFELKRSRYAIALQLILFLVMIWGLFQLLHITVWFLIVCIGLGMWFLSSRRSQVMRLEWLDQDEWSIQYSNSKKIVRAKVIQMIDHHLYVVVYFAEKSIKPMVIWQDQISKKDWKLLKIRVNLF